MLKARFRARGPPDNNVTFENSSSLIQHFYIRYLIWSSHLSYEQDYHLHLTDEEMEIQRQEKPALKSVNGRKW